LRARPIRIAILKELGEQALALFDVSLMAQNLAGCRLLYERLLECLVSYKVALC
jgi:hypothetical protein